ncbi:nesprin-2 isoform X2 [Echeneis naucrates]|uniref:nesprin-2 isoform X2 n=1 Tax=Echeneis naucrates TaxID=173247 RepID=UPI001113E5EB|nr:nesprin-2-like isoform X2 [Echeneis naucrates]
MDNMEFLLTSPHMEMGGAGVWLERRWVLWHEFMEEHAHLEIWLQSAEQAVSSQSSIHVTYAAAKEELRKFERLQCEARCRLVQLDRLTQRNQTLTCLFQGTMRAQLLATVRECGRRWDDVNANLESTTARLKVLVSEWEGFEAQREELILWLADMEVRLTEVDHLTGNSCEKLRRLQSFQHCVCVNSGRVSALLQRGEALIQCSEQTDAQHIESQLLELLRCCSHIYNNIARTHTRLLSMRLVFEDDWILSQATDSGCPSETLLEEEGGLDKPLELPASSNHLKVLPSPAHHTPPPPPTSPTHEHLLLEWDPSVDIGNFVSCDVGDSSYFSASTGLHHKDGQKRWSYLTSLSSLSDITNQEADLGLRWPDLNHSDVFSPVATQGEDPQLNRDQWITSTPDRQESEPISFDGERVRAWLGAQHSALQEGRTSCSKAVQTDREAKEKTSCGKEAKCALSEKRGEASSSFSSLLLYLLLAAALTLMGCLLCAALETPCHRSNRMSQNFHLTLRYINGPPPT